MHRSVRRSSLVPALAVAALSLLALPGAVLAEDQWITTFDFSYRPSSVTVRVGDTVTFVNDDEIPHDAVGSGWSTTLLTQGQSDAVTFSRAGTYRFTCSLHPQMSGSIVVRAASGGGGGPRVTDPPTDTVAPPAAASDAGVGTGAAVLAGSLALLLALVHLRRRTART
jgi:plastocyanin